MINIPKDDRNLLSDPMLCTLVVSSLFTNIPNCKGTQFISELMPVLWGPTGA